MLLFFTNISMREALRRQACDMCHLWEDADDDQGISPNALFSAATVITEGFGGYEVTLQSSILET